MTAFDVLKLREWLTVDEAARRLSTVTSQPVSGASVRRFALDRGLCLSVNFVNEDRLHLTLPISFLDPESSGGTFHSPSLPREDITLVDSLLPSSKRSSR